MKDETVVLKRPGAPYTGDPYNPQTKPMPEYAQRMAKETQEVVTNLRKLSEFIDKSPVFRSLSQLEQQLMFDQKEQMTGYAKTLSLRYCMALLDYG